MKNLSLKQFLITLIFALGIAATVYAGTYISNTATPPQGNTDTPIDVGTLQTVKGIVNGGLGVGYDTTKGGKFQAALAAAFKGAVYVDESEHGMLVGTDLTSPIRFGDASSKVGVAVTGDMFGTKLRAKNLENPNKQHVCANSAGTLVLCAASPATCPSGAIAPNGDVANCDVCKNIEGIQETFTEPFTRTDGSGNCLGPEIPTYPSDYCANLPGIQNQSDPLPAGMVRGTYSGIGYCGYTYAGAGGYQMGATKTNRFFTHNDFVKIFSTLSRHWVEQYSARINLSFIAPLPREVSFKVGYCEQGNEFGLVCFNVPTAYEPGQRSAASMDDSTNNNNSQGYGFWYYGLGRSGNRAGSWYQNGNFQVTIPAEYNNRILDFGVMQTTPAFNSICAVDGSGWLQAFLGNAENKLFCRPGSYFHVPNWDGNPPPSVIKVYIYDFKNTDPDGFIRNLRQSGGSVPIVLKP